MSKESESSPVLALSQLRFIPYRRIDIIAMCLAEDRLSDAHAEQFTQACEKIETHFLQEFHAIKQQLKNAYAPLDPDADTRVVANLRKVGASSELVATMSQVLERANYDKVTDKVLQRAFGAASLFQVRLYVDLDDFEEVLLYSRGASMRQETLREFFGLWRRKVEFVNYDRVLLYIRLGENLDSDSTLGECQPGSTMLKLFQNVPAADLEMLFPNIRVGMRFLDKLMIGVPALVSGGLVLTTKLGATLLLLGSLLGFWFGVSSEPVRIDKAAFLVLLAGFGAVAAFLWKQFSSFRNRKLKYTQALTENLYFKLLDNNAGALYRILDDAEESECKESILAYYFLLGEGRPMTSADLDQAIEAWFAQQWQCKLDFDIEDALSKLCELELATTDGVQWEAALPRMAG
jgi:hypothetical protein